MNGRDVTGRLVVRLRGVAWKSGALISGQNADDAGDKDSHSGDICWRCARKIGLLMSNGVRSPDMDERSVASLRILRSEKQRSVAKQLWSNKLGY